MTFVNLRKPGILMRILILSSQFTFGSIIFLVYSISPRHCHKFVGYLEEHAFQHYTDMLTEIDKKNSSLSHWNTLLAT